MINLEKVHDIIAPSKCLGSYITNLAPAMTIWHDGSPWADGTAVTAATVEVAAGGDMTFTISGGTESRIGSSGVITVSGLTALEVYREVNQVQGWHCRLEGLRGADTVDNSMGTFAEASCFNKQCTLLIDTAVLDVHGLVVSNRKHTHSGGTGASKVAAMENEGGAINKLYYIWITATDATAASAEITIHSITGATTDGETLIGSYLPSATTVETILDFSKNPITAKPGEHLLIRYVAGGAMTAVTELLVNAKSVIIR